MNLNERSGARPQHDPSELERFKRDINLPDFASTFGFALRPDKGTAASVVLERPDTGELVVVRRDTDHHWVYFAVGDTSDSGTILDFVRGRRPGISFGQVRQILRPWLLEPARRPPLPRSAPRVELEPRASDRAAVAIVFGAAGEPDNAAYLNRRGIRPETLQHPRFRGTWRLDARGHVLFPHTDKDGLAGYEIKNRGFTGFASGGIKALWRSLSEPSDTRLVLVESAIDALSYHQLRPDRSTRYASVGGSLSTHQQTVIPAAIAEMPPGAMIILAFDRDDAGEQLATQVRRLAPAATFVRSAPATAKDWNDVLRERERDYILSLAPAPAA